MSELERLREWEQRHDSGIPPGPLDRQTEAERIKDMIACNERLAREFDGIASRREANGDGSLAALSRIDADWHRNEAARLARMLLDKPLPPGPASMQALGDVILGER